MELITKIAAAFTALTLITSVPSMTRDQYKEALEVISASQTEQTDNETLTAPVDVIELCEDITIGWNLGNSLDATGWGAGSETSWGNPVTTKALILKVKEAGFDAVRIPTTWYNHVDSDFNIDESWLDRVQEVVDYAYKRGIFVILNKFVIYFLNKIHLCN